MGVNYGFNVERKDEEFNNKDHGSQLTLNNRSLLRYNSEILKCHLAENPSRKKSCA